MIYEAILYQGMTIDLSTQRKHTHMHEHTHTHRTTSDTDDHTHKSDSMSLNFQVLLFYADLSYLPVIHFNKHQNS